ncbi:TRAP transporter small permease [Lentisphaera marina]|uniref:TRAP transporter small permease n=1 Tax=Lentisphaera marina TaxID=1111041 RepID=UPI0023660C91|nr:TRAP transporter small permease [Lentisphaera marina]MDD7987448.1 TRAP transporter small permease [Lentisphaera marina]
MLNKLKKVKKQMMRLLECLLICMMASLVFVVVYQILARALNLGGTAICSELAQFLLVWVTLLGGSLAFANNAHLGIDYFANKLKGKASIGIAVFAQLCIAFFGAYLLLYGGGKLVALTFRFEQISSAMGVAMGYIYLALPISGLFISLVAFESIAEIIFDKEELK